jgi:NitT/TauT family transport system permease protein
MKRPLSEARWLPASLGLGGLAALLLLVELLIRLEWVSRFIVPLPSEVLMSFERIIMEEDVLSRFLATAMEALAAAFLVSLIGVALGALLHRNQLLRRACESWVAGLAAAPLVLLYPLFLVIFGRNAMTIVMIGFVSGLPPSILKTVEGLSGTRKVLLEVGRSFSLSPSQLFWKIRFPSALPVIFVGVRLGLMFSLINIVGVEFLINFGGLGQLVNELAERYDLAAMYAAICFVILVSVCFFFASEKLERWLLRAA